MEKKNIGVRLGRVFALSAYAEPLNCNFPVVIPDLVYFHLIVPLKTVCGKDKSSRKKTFGFLLVNE